jgi:hypothetical protein
MRVNPHAETPLSLYRSSLAPWVTLPQEGRQRLAAVLELERLQNRKAPLDGRKIIVRNDPVPNPSYPQGHQPSAQLSRPGEILMLDTPELINAGRPREHAGAAPFEP